jgi:hypothetical protein
MRNSAQPPKEDTAMKHFFFVITLVAAFSGAFNAKADEGCGDFGYDYSLSYEGDDWSSWTYSDDYEECEVMCKT